MCKIHTRPNRVLQNLTIASLSESAGLVKNTTPSELEVIEQLSAGMLASFGAESIPYRAQNHKEVAAVLQDMAQNTGAMQVSHYFRAGRAYFTIEHSMGKAGNLFLKSAFDSLLRGCVEKPHVIAEQNHVCVIFRI